MGAFSGSTKLLPVHDFGANCVLHVYVQFCRFEKADAGTSLATLQLPNVTLITRSTLVIYWTEEIDWIYATWWESALSPYLKDDCSGYYSRPSLY